ncbi:hypothetical protein [Flexivirga meconopsidis]|uniref:hypothetical protein n=1 Tax=Flexivirga meconopsidis TaxID=2977121 RepID=UPI002240057F|nr:hypothetical protein [Flexivirga meconopsidis]
MTTPFDDRRPFRPAGAKSAGITRAQLTGDDYRRVFRGCFVATGQDVGLLTRVHAALELVPMSYGVSHHTTASLWGAAPPETSDVHLAVPHKVRCEIPGIRVHRFRKPPKMVQRNGVRLTTPLGTYLDLAPFTELVPLVTLGDSLVRHTGLTAADLVAATAGKEGGRGIRLARRAATLVRSNVDSPRETMLRLLLVLGGLPEPVVDHRIYASDGRLLRRLDLAYLEQLLAIEYDGRHHIERTGQWHGDILRREEFEQLGWRFVVITSPDIWRTPGATLDRVGAALRERGVVLPRRTDAWRAHFPERRGLAG